MEADRPVPARWFKPGQEVLEEWVPGTYHVDVEGRIEAHLHGPVDRKGAVFFPQPSDAPSTLCGEILGDGAPLVTIVGCSLVRSQSSLREIADMTLRAAYALEGFFSPDEGDRSFTDVRLRFSDQDVWTDWDRVAVAAPRQWGGLDELGAELRPVPQEEAAIDGGTLRLVDDSSAVEDPQKRRWVLQSRSRFELHFDEPVPVDDVLTRYVYPIQVMLLSASGRLPGVVSMGGTNRHWVLPDGDRHLPSRWLEVRRFHGAVSTASATDLKYLHRLRDLDFAAHVPAMLRAVDTHRYAIEHYGALHSEGHYRGSLERFVAAAQLAEAFDHSLHPGDTRDAMLDKRLKRLEDESGNLIDGIIGNRRWRGEVARLRNMVLHGDARARVLLHDPRALVCAYEALLLQFEVRLLVEFGFDVDRAKALATERVQHWTIVEAIREYYPALADIASKQSNA